MKGLEITIKPVLGGSSWFLDFTAIPLKPKQRAGFTFHVDRLETIESAKKRLADILNKPPRAMRLIFDGKQLQDESTFDEYNIGEESVVDLTFPI